MIQIPTLPERVFELAEPIEKSLESEHTEEDGKKKHKRKKNKQKGGQKKAVASDVDEEPIKRIEIVRSQPIQFSKSNKKPQQKPAENKPLASQPKTPKALA